MPNMSLVCRFTGSLPSSRMYWCGQPAIGETKWGSPRCARHTEEALAADKRLRDAAPALLAALTALLTAVDYVQTVTLLQEDKTLGRAANEAAAALREARGPDA